MSRFRESSAVLSCATYDSNFGNARLVQARRARRDLRSIGSFSLLFSEFASNLVPTLKSQEGPMRSARVLAVLLVLATSTTALAATKAIKFGKLVDGNGGVFTNAVVIVDDDRVQSVAAGSASIPSGAQV